MLTPPLILFIDDGVHIFSSGEEIARQIEAADVREYPEGFGFGFDSEGHGFRLAVERFQRKLFLWFEIFDERVRVVSDLTLTLETAPDITRDQMIGFLSQRDSKLREPDFMRLANQELFRKVIREALRAN
jgi:hypothetical protein